MKKILVVLNTIFLGSWLITACTKKSVAVTKANLPEKKTLHLAVFGDSLAAGLLADRQVGTTLKPADAKYFLEQGITIWGGFSGFSEADKHNDEKIKAFVKTTKYRIVDEHLANQEFSIFEGNKPYSFKRKIEEKLKTEVKVMPFAVSGTRTYNFSDQVDEMQIGYQPKSLTPMPKADIIVIHVGGNDWCDMRPGPEFKSDLEENIRRILELNPEARVLVFPISDLVSVLKAKDTLAFKSSLKSPTCSEMRKFHRVCASRAIQMDSTESLVEGHRKDLAFYNEIVAQVVKNAPTKVPSFRGKIDIANEYAETFVAGKKHEEFRSEWLAVDCFHPGPLGEQVIGEIAWSSMDRFLTANPK